MQSFLLFLCLFILFSFGTITTPVIIIPSFGGNSLEAQLKDARFPDTCETNADWYTMWYEPNQMSTSDDMDCWMATIDMNYTKTGYSNTPGVQIRGKDFGGISGITFLDDEHKIPFWNYIVSSLTNMGYTPGTSLRAATYDWRLGPDSFSEGIFEQLKSLIEDTYTKNNNQPVTILAHGSGSALFVLFCNQKVDPIWKAKYIRSWTSLSGIFGGTSNALSLALSTQTILSTDIVDPRVLRYFLQGWGGLTWLFPSPQVYGNRVWITSPTSEFSAPEFYDMLFGNGFTKQAAIISKIQKDFKLADPGVNTTCVYGNDTTTLETMAACLVKPLPKSMS
jgi:lysophospholipase-3